MTAPAHGMTAILPCNDLNLSERFYARLGFVRDQADVGASALQVEYLILSDSLGARLHLTQAVDGWLTPGRNPFGLYFCVEDVDRLADAFRAEIIEIERRPEYKPWGMYEFSLSDPDETLVRVGWPSRLMHQR
jgi:Glyoxalase-like domain